MEFEFSKMLPDGLDPIRIWQTLTKVAAGVPHLQARKSWEEHPCTGCVYALERLLVRSRGCCSRKGQDVEMHTRA